MKIWFVIICVYLFTHSINEEGVHVRTSFALFRLLWAALAIPMVNFVLFLCRLFKPCQLIKCNFFPSLCVYVFSNLLPPWLLGLFQWAVQMKAEPSEVSLHSCGEGAQFPFCWCSLHMCATEGDIKGTVPLSSAHYFFTAVANLAELREPIKQGPLFELIY